MKIIEALWFDKIGIILAKDDVTDKYKSYIGIGEGSDEEADTKYISQHGKPFPTNAALELFGKAKNKGGVK